MLLKEHKTRGGLDIRFKPLQKKGTVPFQSITAPSHFVLMVISTDGNFFSRSPWMSLFWASQWWECVSEIQKMQYYIQSFDSHNYITGRQHQWVRDMGLAIDCTYGEHCCVELSRLAVVEVKLEKMLHLPVREQRTVWAEQNTVSAVDVAHPDRQPGGFQHAAHLRKKGIHSTEECF